MDNPDIQSDTTRHSTNAYSNHNQQQLSSHTSVSSQSSQQNLLTQSQPIAIDAGYKEEDFSAYNNNNQPLLTQPQEQLYISQDMDRRIDSSKQFQTQLRQIQEQNPQRQNSPIQYFQEQEQQKMKYQADGQGNQQQDGIVGHGGYYLQQKNNQDFNDNEPLLTQQQESIIGHIIVEEKNNSPKFVIKEEEGFYSNAKKRQYQQPTENSCQNQVGKDNQNNSQIVAYFDSQQTQTNLLNFDFHSQPPFVQNNISVIKQVQEINEEEKENMFIQTNSNRKNEDFHGLQSSSQSYSTNNQNAKFKLHAQNQLLEQKMSSNNSNSSQLSQSSMSHSNFNQSKDQPIRQSFKSNPNPVEENPIINCIVVCKSQQPMDIIYQSPKHTQQNQERLVNCNVNQPMQIQFQNGHKVAQNEPQQSISSKEYAIEVTNCNDELVGSVIKNNDIYEIESDKLQQTNTNEENGNKNENIVDIGIVNVQCNQLEIKKEQEQQQYKRQHVDISQRDQTDHKQKDKIDTDPIQEMRQILYKQITDKQKFQHLVEVLSPHVNLLFVEPITSKGVDILRDGLIVVDFIEAMSLKQEEKGARNYLKRYMIASLSSKIRINQDRVEVYRQQICQQTHQLFPSVQNKTNSSQYKLRVNAQEPTSADKHQSQQNNQSVFANDGSDCGEEADKINIIEDKPIKRTVLLNNQPQLIGRPKSPRSGKVTRKMRIQPLKNKGKTTAKKSVVINTNHKQSEVNHRSKSQNQSKSRPKKSALKKIDIQQLEKSHRESLNENLGSKYKYALKEDRNSDRVQLVQVRVSARLIEKNKEHDRHTSGSKQKKKKGKHSAVKSSQKKVFFEDDGSSISVNYVMNHFRELQINQALMMQSDFDALTDQDFEITKLLMKQMQKQFTDDELNVISNHISIGQVSQYQEQPNHEQQRQDNEDTRTNSRRIKERWQEFNRTKKQYRPEVIIIARVIDPNINNNGIYALLELSKISQVLQGAKYAITPITNLQFANKRLIEEDIQTAKGLVGEKEKDNLAYIKLNPTIMKMIKDETQKKKH